MAKQRARGWWYPWIFVGGMAVVFVANGMLVVGAIDTFPGLETTDAYRKGLAYNDAIAASDAQAARGWSVRLEVAPATGAEGARAAALTATFVDRDGIPLRGLDVMAYLIRPTAAGRDVATPLDERGGGVYAAAVEVPLPGQWDVRIHARDRAAATFQKTQRIFVP